MEHSHDRHLLRDAANGDSGAFSEFYRRHVRSLPRSSSTAPALPAWLYGIARRKLALSRGRGRVEASARERLAREPLELTASDRDAISRLAELLPADTPALDLLDRLPEPQREAIRARMLDELEYPEIARGLPCSEAVVRQRVSRGMRTLRVDAERRELGA